MISQWRWQHLITTSFPGKIEHAGKNDHSIEATTKSNDPLQTVAKTLANLHQHLPVPYNKIYFGSLTTSYLAA